MLSVYKQMLGGQVDYRQDLSHFIEGRLDRLYPKALSIMKFHNLVIFFTPVTQNVKPIGAFAFLFIKRFLASLMITLLHQLLFICFLKFYFYLQLAFIVSIFRSFFWRMIVVITDYLSLKCENIKDVCTGVNMNYLNYL